MTYWNTYTLPQTLSEALTALAAAPGPARFVAGGTDLLLDLQQGRHPPVHTLIDVTELPELRALELRGDSLFIGAGVPLNRIVASSLVQSHAPGLIEACQLIGGPQVRNTATLGGNVAHALPAADGTISLLAHGAQAEIASLTGGRAGCRQAPLEELFLGPGRSALVARGELLVGFWLPLLLPGQASAFRRVMRPQGVAIAILNLGVWLERQADRVTDVRIVAGPSGPIPRRARQAESVLIGRAPTPQALADGAAALLDESSFRSSPHRASSIYRRHLAGLLLEETFLTAWERADRGQVKVSYELNR